jgi:hypothetical protein
LSISIDNTKEEEEWNLILLLMENKHMQKYLGKTIKDVKRNKQDIQTNMEVYIWNIRWRRGTY